MFILILLLLSTNAFAQGYYGNPVIWGTHNGLQSAQLIPTQLCFPDGTCITSGAGINENLAQVLTNGNNGGNQSVLNISGLAIGSSTLTTPIGFPPQFSIVEDLAGGTPVIEYFFAAGDAGGLTGNINLFNQSRGTPASPTPTQNGDNLLIIGVSGYGTTGFASNFTSGSLSFEATQNWTDSAQGTGFTLSGTPNGSTSHSTLLKSSNGIDLVVGNGGGTTTVGACNFFSGATTNCNQTIQAPTFSNSTAGSGQPAAVFTATVAQTNPIQSWTDKNNRTSSISATGDFQSAGGLSGDLGRFNVDNTGNITLINNVPSVFPSLQGSNHQVYTNDGFGTITWQTVNADNVTNGSTNKFYSNTLVQTYLSTVEGQPNGIATLDGGGKIPSGQLPPITVSNTYVVASQAAMLALSANVGDLAIRTDISETFALSALPASTLGNWQQLLAPPTGVTSVNSDPGPNVVLTTSNITEGSNLYYTDARARAAITATAPIVNTSGLLTCNAASGSQPGCLSSADWTTFNSKQAAGSYALQSTTITGGPGISGGGSLAASRVLSANDTIFGTVLTTNQVLPSNTTFMTYLVSTASASSALQITLPAASSVSNGTSYVFVDTGGNLETWPLTLIPNGGDSIGNFGQNKSYYTNYGTLRLTSDGVSNWLLTGSSSKKTRQHLTTSGTWIAQAGVTTVRLRMRAGSTGGTGGSGGGFGNNTTAGGGGGSAQSGGGSLSRELEVDLVPGTSYSYVVGAGGTGGAGGAGGVFGSTQGVRGTLGGVGGNSSFGSLFKVYPGNTFTGQNNAPGGNTGSASGGNGTTAGTSEWTSRFGVGGEINSGGPNQQGGPALGCGNSSTYSFTGSTTEGGCGGAAGGASGGGGGAGGGYSLGADSDCGSGGGGRANGGAGGAFGFPGSNGLAGIDTPTFFPTSGCSGGSGGGGGGGGVGNGAINGCTSNGCPGGAGGNGANGVAGYVEIEWTE